MTISSNPNLSNLNLLLPPSQRYTYVFDGNAQTLDHALANAALTPWVSRFAYGRSNADFPQSLYGSTDARRLTDHDGSVAYINLGTPSVTAQILDAEMSPTGETWVDIEIRNGGDGFADQIAITEIRFSALKASPPRRVVECDQRRVPPAWRGHGRSCFRDAAARLQLQHLREGAIQDANGRRAVVHHPARVVQLRETTSPLSLDDRGRARTAQLVRYRHRSRYTDDANRPIVPE